MDAPPNYPNKDKKPTIPSLPPSEIVGRKDGPTEPSSSPPSPTPAMAAARGMLPASTAVTRKRPRNDGDEKGGVGRASPPPPDPGGEGGSGGGRYGPDSNAPAPADRGSSAPAPGGRARRPDACARSASGAPVAEPPNIPLRKLIPPQDCARIRRRLDRGDVQRLRGDIDDEDGMFALADLGGSSFRQFGWPAVIARVRSHPHEAAEPYFGPPLEPLRDSGTAAAAAASSSSSMTMGSSAVIGSDILTYKPLHAMLKYDPPLEAVEAVLRAHPEAALDVTFEGTALRIASECRVGSMPVLRLLLVAEMAMRKKLALQRREEAQDEVKGRRRRRRLGRLPRLEEPASSAGENDDNDPPPTPHEPLTSMFHGYNPILWIAERRVPVGTAALLLRWYPSGAFRRPRDEDGAPAVDDGAVAFTAEEVAAMMGQAIEAESPLIEIVDDFARDHCDDNEDNENGEEGEYDSCESETDDDNAGAPQMPLGERQQGIAQLSRWPRANEEREQLCKERRWEKFLHILYATDLSLQLATVTSLAPAASERGLPVSSTSHPEDATAADRSEQNPVSTFRPVHAWVRCVTCPRLGLERCRPYGAWSIFRTMADRIPAEFAARDEPGGRTAFQTLAERPASDCRLCREEVRDVVECLIDVDHRSAFLPRKSDGRLLGHVALENGWPCKDLFSRKKSATCA